MKKFFSFFAALLFAGSMMAETETIFTYNGKGVTTAEEIVKAGGTLTVYGGNTNIAADQKQKGNMCLKINKGFTKSGVYYYMAITLDKPLQAGDKITTAAFRTGTSDCVYGMDFNVATDSASASETVQVLFDNNLQVLSSDGIPADTTFEVPAAAAGAKFIRLYRKSGATGLWIANFTITREGGVTPPVPTMNYYVTGNMTSWGPQAAYMLTPDNEGLYKGEFTFAANDEFKVTYSDGTTIEDANWFPSGMDNNYQITEAGDYAITFNPAGGVQDWYYGYFDVKMKEQPIIDTITCDSAKTAALAGKTNEVYVKGYVTEIAFAWKEGTMSFWMADAKDGGKVFEAYKCAIADEADAVRVGDLVKAHGTLTKYNTTPELAAGCTVEILERAEAPKNLGDKTIAEFIALANTVDTCVLTGVVDSIKNATYGNLYMSDATGSLYVYGVLTPEGEAKKFADLGVDEGDTLTIKAIYNLYQDAPQAKNAIFVEVKKAPAAPVYTVVGSSAPLFTETWEPAYEANNMNPITGSEYLYAWKKEGVALAAGAIEYKVCQDHGWNPAWPQQGNYSFTIAEEGLYDVTIFFNPELETPTQVVAEFKGAVVVLPNIILHGNFTGSWADTEAFTPAADSLTASLELALTAGIYEFGFKFDGNWKANGAQLTREANATNLAEGSGNMFVTADVPGNYIFTYTYATQAVEVTYPNPIIVPDTVVVDAVTYGEVYTEDFEQYGAVDVVLTTQQIVEQRIEGDGFLFFFDIYPEDANNITGNYYVDSLTFDPDYSGIMEIAGADTINYEIVDGAVSFILGQYDIDQKIAQLATIATLEAEDGTVFIISAAAVVYYDFIIPQGVEDVTAEPKKVIKKIEMGNVVIEKNGVRYNINGQMIR